MTTPAILVILLAALVATIFANIVASQLEKYLNDQPIYRFQRRGTKIVVSLLLFVLLSLPSLWLQTGEYEQPVAPAVATIGAIVSVTPDLTNAVTDTPTPKLEEDNKTTVLVANFDGPEEQNYRVTEEILRNLNDTLRVYTDTQVIALNEAITEQQGSLTAREIGNQHKADIILWGWYGVTESNVNVTFHIENLRHSPLMLLTGSDVYSAKAPVADVKSFDFQSRLSEDLVAISLLISGITRFEAHQYDQAIDRFIAGIDKSKRGTGVSDVQAILYNYKGLANAFQEYYDKALDDFSQAISIAPGLSQPYNNRGVMIARSSRTSEPSEQNDVACIAWYPQYGSSYTIPNVEYAVSFAGQEGKPVYTSREESMNAIADFSSAIDIDSNFSEAYFNRGTAYSNLCDYGRAADDFKAAISANPGFVGAYNNLGNLYMQTLSGFSIVRADSNPFTETARLDIEGDYTRRAEEAIRYYSSAIQLAPQSAELFFNRAVASNWLSLTDNALEDYTKAIQLNNAFVDAYYNRGLIYNRQENYWRVISDMTKVIEIAGRDFHPVGKAYAFRADAYFSLHRCADAISDYTTAIQLDPEDQMSYAKRADCLAQSGDIEAAITDLSQSIALDPTDARDLYNRGNLQSELGRYQEAIDDFSQALIISPTLSFAYNNRGAAYNELGHTEDAILDFTLAIEVDPQNTVAYFNRGNTYEAIGNIDRALIDFCAMLSLDIHPDQRYIVERSISEMGKSLSDCSLFWLKVLPAVSPSG